MKNIFLNKISLGRFENTLFLVVLITLPFEHLLTFEFLGFTLKLSYLAGLMLIAYYLFLVLKGKKKIRFEIYDFALLAFIVLSYLTAFWSIDRQITLIISSMLLFMFLIFFCARNILDKNFIESCFQAFVILGVLTSLFGLYQFVAGSIGVLPRFTGISEFYDKSLFGFPRVQSTFLEPQFFANFLLIPLYISVYKFLKHKNSAYLLCLLICGTAFFLTLSRGGILAFGVTFAVFLVINFIYRKDYRLSLLKTIIVLFLSAIISFCMVFVFSGREGVGTYLGQATNQADISVGEKVESITNPTRNFTIKLALRTAKEHPFGIGTGSFGSLPEFEAARKAGHLRQTVNNLYAEIFVEQGILGLLSFAAFLFLIVIELIKKAGNARNTICLFIVLVFLL